MAELDLLELLSADHRQLLDEDPLSVTDLAQHLGVERELLFPIVRRYARDGDAIVAALRSDERRLEDLMADFERHRPPEVATAREATEEAASMAEALQEHVRALEPLFSQLRRDLPAEVLVRSARSVALSIGAAPTHAHPRMPEGGPMGELAEDMASVSDHVRDRFRGR